MIQSISFTSAAFEAFAESHLCFLVSSSAKKNAEVINFLEILKQICLREQNILLFKKKSNVSLNKKVIFVFHKADHLLYYPQMSVFSFHIYFLYSLISVSKKQNIETMLTFPYSYNLQKFNNKMNEKRSQEYQSMDPEYVTGQTNIRILELVVERCCLIFALSQKF